MRLEEAILRKLKAHAGLSALVKDRVYYGEAPQGQPLPYVTLTSDETYDYTMGSTDTDVTAYPQVDAWAKTYGEADKIKIQIMAALNQASGNLATVDDPCNVLIVLATNSGYRYDDKVKVHHKWIVFRVLSEE